MNDPIITQNPIESGELYNVDGNTNTTTNPTTLTEYDIAKLIQEETTKQMPMTQGALPPQYYYPSMGDNVIKGHTQTPIGSFALVSPSARFPMGVLDAMEREEAARKTQQMLEEFKPIDKKFYRTLNSSWNTEWLAYQKESYDNAINKAYEQAGSWAGARMILRRDGTLEEMQAEFMAQQQLYDEAWKAAQDIIATNIDPKNKYVSKYVRDAAYKFIDTKFGSYETEEARFDALHDSRNIFVKAVGMEQASLPYIKRWNDTIIQDEALRKAVDEGGKSLNTMAQNVYAKVESQGLSALNSSEEMQLAFFQGVEDSYNAAYGTLRDAGKDFAVPTLDEYTSYVYSHIKDVRKADLQTVSQSPYIGKAWYDRQNWTDIGSTLMTIGGRNVNVTSLPITKSPFMITGQQADFVVDKDGKRKPASNFAGGMVIGVVETNIDGNIHRLYQVVPKDKFTYNPKATTEADMWRFTGSMDDSYLVAAQGFDNNFNKYANDNKLNITGETVNAMQQVSGDGTVRLVFTAEGSATGAYTGGDTQVPTKPRGTTTQTNQPTQQQVNNWNNQWNALPSGGTLVGLDGKTYTKQ